MLAGALGTVFLNNTDAIDAGDITAIDTAAVHISGASLAGGKAVWDGGSLHLNANNLMTIVDTTIQEAWAQGEGGCVMVTGNTTLRVSNPKVSGCRAGQHGGGIRLVRTAQLDLVNSSVTSNVAGLANSTVTSTAAGLAGNVTASAFGGGIAAKDASRVQLQGAIIQGNTASLAAGGLALSGTSTLVVTGPDQTLVVNNTAGELGGGVRLLSPNFSPSLVSSLLLVNNSSAPVSRIVPLEYGTSPWLMMGVLTTSMPQTARIPCWC